MLPKLTQGVTTVIVGNCGISGAPSKPNGTIVDPMNLLGAAEEFQYPTFSEYVAAVRRAAPAVNVAAMIGHTVLRNNHMDRLDREATNDEVAAMRAQLHAALNQGAIGLSTGLAYASAYSASTKEVMALAECLIATGAIYATHLRSESDRILPAIEEAFNVGRHAHVLRTSRKNCSPRESLVHRTLFEFRPNAIRGIAKRVFAGTASPAWRDLRVRSHIGQSLSRQRKLERAEP